MHHCFEIDAALVEEVFQLGKVPLRSVLRIVVVILSRLTTVSTSVLDVVFVLFVYGVVGQMDKALIRVFLTVGVLLGGETHQPLLKQIHLEGIKSGHKSVNSKIIFETFDQVWVAHVLRHHIARLPLHLLLLTYDFDSTSAGGGAGLHDVHMSEILCLPIHA